jgi:hypothetical protein
MERHVQILGFDVKKSDWHPEEQLLMSVYDIDKKEYREYATKDIIKWIKKLE